MNMEAMEEIKSQEWFHLIDHMYAKWPKVNFPFLTKVEDGKISPHIIPDVMRNPYHRRRNSKRKKGRKRRSMQKPTAKRAGASVPGTQKRANPRKEGVSGKGASAASVPRRISIIQTRAQKGGGVEGKVRVGLHYRQCPCCESALLKPRTLSKIEAADDRTAGEEEDQT
ncbi:uncharacterized protein LOC124167835 [Ischnura elegans]|uniref:uncharacterized protein LOC124167835 n=1 Tax=Ischnura elegans TaxID=197161 RepID=UPI001ED8A3B4|nr:uncharacterized protein LOC124167835 [Ischnura elegans]